VTAHLVAATPPYVPDPGMSRLTVEEARPVMDALRKHFSAEVEITAAEIGDLGARMGGDGMTPYEIAETMQEWMIDALADWMVPGGTPRAGQLTWTALMKAIRAAQEAGTPAPGADTGAS
jgi:hypothetical protein